MVTFIVYSPDENVLLFTLKYPGEVPATNIILPVDINSALSLVEVISPDSPILILPLFDVWKVLEAPTGPAAPVLPVTPRGPDIVIGVLTTQPTKG